MEILLYKLRSFSEIKKDTFKTPTQLPLLPQSQSRYIACKSSISLQILLYIYIIPIVSQILLEKCIFPHIYILMYSHSVACEIAIGQTVLNGAVLAVRCHRCSEQGDINVGSSS